MLHFFKKENYYFTPVCNKSRKYDLQFPRYRAWQAELRNFRSFFALLPFYQILKKNEKKKLLEISSLYTCVWKMTIIRYTVPEIWSETDRVFVILDHFLPLYPLTISKIKILIKRKKLLEILLVYTTVP